MVVIVFKVILLQILRISLVLTQIEKVYYGLQQANKQWGKGHDTQFVTFPIAFTQQAFCCIVTPIGGGQGSDRVYSLSVKSFQILCGTNNDGLWLALGI